jgi:hypothetical protein
MTTRNYHNLTITRIMHLTISNKRNLTLNPPPPPPRTWILGGALVLRRLVRHRRAWCASHPGCRAVVSWCAVAAAPGYPSLRCLPMTMAEARCRPAGRRPCRQGRWCTPVASRRDYVRPLAMAPAAPPARRPSERWAPHLQGPAEPRASTCRPPVAALQREQIEREREREREREMSGFDTADK